VDANLYRHSKSEKPALRIGLLLEVPLLSRCSAEVVDHIIQSDFARLEMTRLSTTGAVDGPQTD
jgi:hypothetical protein